MQAREEDTDVSCQFEVSPGKVIDVFAGALRKRRLYFGAPFANTPYINCTTAEDYAKYEKIIGVGRIQTAL